MKQTKRKPLLNRKETQTLLTTLKMATAAGALSLTIGGWSLLAQLETRNVAQAAASPPVAVVASASRSTASASRSIPPTSTPTPTPLSPQATPVQKKFNLDIVQWVQDISGNPVAVVRDRRGTLWYVMGSDVTRLEQGLSPLVQPQPVRITTRTRGS